MTIQEFLKSLSQNPVIVAPMGGGATTPALVAAACEAGAFGFLAASYLSASQIHEAAQAVRAQTSRPFGINLFAPTPAPAPYDPAPLIARLESYHHELGIPSPSLTPLPASSFEERLAACLESGASVLSFTFGLIPPEAIRDARARKMLVIGTATTVEEAIALQAAGVDAVVAQGSEAGAHRGTFASDFGAAMIGTVSLVPQIVDAVSIPVVASGGIMDGRGIAAALALGACAVQMGTAFLTCDESGIPEAHKHAILQAREDETRVTRAFSGRPARGIVNRVLEEIEAAPGAILPYPVQNALTRPLRTAAAAQGRPEFLSLWAGQGVRLARRQPAAALVRRLVEETESAIQRLSERSQPIG